MSGHSSFWRKPRLLRLLDGRDGASAVAQTLATNVTMQVLNIGTGILSARLLHPVGRGEFAAILLAPQFLAGMFTLGLPAGVVYLAKREPEHATAYVGISLLISTVLGLTVAAVATPLLPYWLNEYSPGVVRFAQWAVWLIPLGVASHTLNSVLLIHGQYGRYNFIRLSQPALTLLGFVVMVVWGRFNPYMAVVISLGASTLLFAVNAFWVTRFLPPRLTPFIATTRKLLHYASRAWSIDLTGTLASQVDRVLVVALLVPADLGLYVVAQSAGRLIQLVPNSLLPVLFPRASGRAVHEVVDLTGFSARASLLIMLLVVLPLMLLAHPLLRWVYGHAFAGAATVMRLLIIEAVLVGINGVLTQAFMALGRPGLVGFIQGTSLPVTLLLLWLMVPRWGLAGAGMALVIAALARLAFTQVCFRVVLGTPPPKLWPRLADVLRVLHSLRSVHARSAAGRI